MINLLNRQLIRIQQDEDTSELYFHIDKDSLFLFPLVAENPSFTNMSEWELVAIIYKKPNSAKRFTPSFRGNKSSSKAKMKSGISAGDSFEFRKIIISKKDRSQHIIIKRAQLEQSDFYDFQLNTGSVVVNQPPFAPSNVSSSLSGFSVVINFSNSLNATSYKIYRGSTSNNLSFIGSSNTNSYQDSTTTKGSTYYYAVKASNGDDSGFSSIVNIKIPVNSPSNVSSSIDTDGLPLVSWDAITGADSYKVYKGSSPSNLICVAIVLTPSFKDEFAAIGETSYYAVSSYNGAESPSLSSLVSAVALPATPSNFIASLSSGLPSLSWSAISGVLYKIFRSTNSNNAGTAIASDVDSNQYQDSSANAGMTYYYSISAVQNGSESPKTTQLSVFVALSQPINLTISLSNRKPSLNWADVTGATSYKIYRGSSEDNLTLIDTSSDSEYVDNNAPVGTSYYKVKAANNLTESVMSDASSSLVPPSKPTSVGSSATTTSARISWQAVDGASSYIILRGPAANSMTVLESGVSASPYIDSSVTSGGDYYYSVRSSNGEESESSDAILVNVPLVAPSISANASSSQVSINWGAVSGAYSYKVYRGTSSGDLSLIAENVTDTSYVDTSITKGSTYYYGVKSSDEVDSEMSQEVEAIVPVDAPSSVSSSVNQKIITVSWTAVSGADYYKVFRGTSSGSLSLVAENVTESSYQDNSLSGNTRYYYAVKSYNGSDSVLSSEVNNLTSTDAPQNLSVTINPVSNKPDLSWDAVSGAVGNTAYRVYRGTSSDNLVELSNIPSNTLQDGNAVDGRSYYYAVKANNGTFSDFSNVVQATLPDRTVTDLTVEQGMDMPDAFNDFRPTASLSWSPLIGGSYIYKIYRGTSSSNLNELVATTSYNASSVDVINVYNTQYYYAVVPVQEGVASAKSNIVPFIIEKPDAPVLLSPTQSSTSVALDWNDVSQATYDVFRGTGIVSASSMSLLNSSSTSDYSDTGLSYGSTYSYSVKAKKNGVSSDASNVKSIKLVNTASASSSSTAKNNLVLTWSSASGADSYDVKYKRDIDANYTTLTGQTSPVTVSSLSSGEAYDVKIVSKNSVGDGNSVESSAVRAYPTASVSTTTSSNLPTVSSVSSGALNSTMSYNLLAYGNGVFLAAKSDLKAISASQDGVTWRDPISASNTNTITGLFMKYLNGNFVVGKILGYFHYSSDGLSWTQRSLLQTCDVTDMAYGLGYYVGVSNSLGSQKIYYSTDLTANFTTVTSPNLSLTAFNAIEFGGSRFVTVSSSYYPAVTEVQLVTFSGGSNNGTFTLTWNGITSQAFAYNATAATIQTALRTAWSLPSLTVTGTVYNTPCALTITFTGTTGNIAQMTCASSLKLNVITSTNVTAVVTTPTQGAIHNVAYSTNGTTWSTSFINQDTSYTWRALAYGNSKFMAVGGYSSNTKGAISTSTDGITWTTNSSVSTSTELLTAAFGSTRFVAVDSSAVYYTANDGTSWTKVAISGLNTITSPKLVFANNKFVLLCVEGVASSSDGVTWAVSTVKTSFVSAFNSASIAWTGTNYVAATTASVSPIYGALSTDGISWAPYNAGLLSSTNAMAYGNDMLVAVRNSGNISYSRNQGKSWFSASLPLSMAIQSVTFANGQFVAVASTNSFRILTSPDGITWTYRYSPNELSAWKGITYGNGMFFGVGSAVTSVAMQRITFSAAPTSGTFTLSYKGVSTTALAYNATALDVQTALNAVSGITGPVTVTGAISASVTSGLVITWPAASLNISKLVVASSSLNASSGAVTVTVTTISDAGNTATGMRSTDGVTWTLQSMGSTLGTYNGVTYGGSKFVAVGDAGAISYSSDGLNWTYTSVSSTLNIQSVAYGANLYVAVCSTGTNRFLRSSDGINWTNFASPDDSDVWDEITFANGKFIAVSSSGYSATKVAYSTNGTTWTFGTFSADLTTYSFPTITETAYGNNNFIAISNTANYIMNDTGYTAPFSLSSIAYGNGVFVSHTALTAIRYSTDGINWNTVSGISLAGYTFYLSFAGDKFFLMSTSTCYSSTDGINWTSFTPPSSTWTKVTYGNGKYYASANYSTNLMTSTNGTNWSLVSLPNGATFWANGVAYGRGMWVVVGDSYSFFTSADNGATWTKRALPQSAYSAAAIYYTSGLFIMLIGSGSYYSKDGLTWTQFFTGAGGGTNPYSSDGNKIRFYVYTSGLRYDTTLI